MANRAACAAMSKEQLVEMVMKLQDNVELERKRANNFAEELRIVREQSLAVHKQVEQEEEAITNRLMKRLEQLKKEKQLLATEVEQEEEFLTNNLQKRLEKITKEKVELEKRLEAEQEYVFHSLRKQLDQLQAERLKLHREKVDLENQLEAEQEHIVNTLHKQLQRLGQEKAGLQLERSDLQRQVHDLGAAVERLNKDRVALENSMEAEEEAIVNRLQRQLEALLGNYRQLEAKLEARGLTLRDVGLSPADVPHEALGVYSRGASGRSSGELSRSWGSGRGVGELGGSGGSGSMKAFRARRGVDGDSPRHSPRAATLTPGVLTST